MKLPQVFFGLLLVPAMGISASTQNVSGGLMEYSAMLLLERSGDTTSTVAPFKPHPKTTATPETTGEPEAHSVSLPRPIPTPLHLGSRGMMYTASYMDAYRILKEDNSCSRFFGGAASATEVLNRLTEQIQKKRLENNQIAIRMSGSYTNFHDRQTGASFRLFAEVILNTAGPLFIPPAIAATQRQAIGRFSTNTRAARVLILLHELGHMVRGADGRWLLPNDGHSADLSLQNTGTVQSRCLKQLTAVRD